MVDFDKDRRESYVEEGYYNKGMMLNSDFGYFRFDELNPIYIDELNQHGLKYYTNLVGPSYNSDIIAVVETIYLYKDEKWSTYDFDVYDSDNVVKAAIYTESRKESIMANHFKRLEELFSMSIDEDYTLKIDTNE